MTMKRILLLASSLLLLSSQIYCNADIQESHLDQVAVSTQEVAIMNQETAELNKQVEKLKEDVNVLQEKMSQKRIDALLDCLLYCSFLFY